VKKNKSNVECKKMQKNNTDVGVLKKGEKKEC